MGLFFRRPVIYILFSLSFYAVAYYAEKLPFLALLFGIILCQIFLSLCIIITKSVDECTKIKVSECFNNIKTYIFYLTFLSVLYFLIFIALAVITVLSKFDVPTIDYSKNELYILLRWLRAGALEFYILYMAILVTSLWFLNPLLIINKLNLRDSIKLAKFAEDMNGLVVFIASYVPFIVYLLLLMTTEIYLVIAFVLFPLFGIFQYVSYRHIFLGKKENSPVLKSKESMVLSTENSA